jgi:hypothetical protein
MSGAFIGYNDRTIEGKRFCWGHSSRRFLPTLYGTEGDYKILFDTGSMILVEGIFDRVALKRCFPNQAVFSRMTVGLSIISYEST